jgi:hypothetical protein
MTDERIIAYLLGELPEEESEQFEDECFAEESWPAQISLGEEDLIDAYLCDELTQERRQRFELHYLTTQARQERVSMAAALLRHVNERHASKRNLAEDSDNPTWIERFRAFWNSQSWALRAAMSFGVIAILAGGLWLSLFRAQSPKTFAAITLTHSVNNRAEGVQAGKVKLPLKADALRISLMLPERLPAVTRYRVELENEDGETRPLEVVGQDAQSVSVVIQASQLERGLYALNLFTTGANGTEQSIDGSYFFTVE